MPEMDCTQTPDQKLEGIPEMDSLQSPDQKLGGMPEMDSPQSPDQKLGGSFYRTSQCCERNPKRSLLVLGLVFLLSLFAILHPGLRLAFFYITLILTGLIAVFLALRFMWQKFILVYKLFILQCKRRRERSRPNDIEDSISPLNGEVSPPSYVIEADHDFDGDCLKSLSGLPTVFRFQAIETATGNFSKEIGSGGFGKVYEGSLTDGTPVAVKCLVNQTGQGQREFCSEIATISSLNHSNLVSLRGVCMEGSHRILVYEFMPNGSLDKWLFASDKQLDWKTRYSIALDTARGLAYLHEDSRLCILHLDIKPQNILLDGDFKAKVSDFGMARSLKRDSESRVVTGVRGTPGYMAPEWFQDRGITYKTDVFSYGMVLLEIIRGVKNVDNTQDSDSWYFPSIAFKKARQGKMDELIDSGLKLKSPQEMDEAYRLIKTALWCIQTNSTLRPSMGTVVRFLKGDLEIMDPPLTCKFPFAQSLDDETLPDATVVRPQLGLGLQDNQEEMSVCFSGLDR